MCVCVAVTVAVGVGAGVGVGVGHVTFRAWDSGCLRALSADVGAFGLLVLLQVWCCGFARISSKNGDIPPP